MCEVDQETTPSSPLRAGCHRWAAGPCPPPTPWLDTGVAVMDEGSREEVCGVRTDRHIRCTGRGQHHSIKGKLRHRPVEPVSMVSLAPSPRLGCAPATPEIIPLVLEEAPHPHLPSVRLHTALPLTAVAPGILRCSGALICSTPGDQCLAFTQPQSYGSHTLCGLPQLEERGAAAPWGGDWSPTNTRTPPSATPGFRLPSFCGQISLHSLCTPNVSKGETVTSPSKMFAKRPKPTSAAPYSSPARSFLVLSLCL